VENLPYWAKQAQILKVPGLLYVAPVPGIKYYFGIFATPTDARRPNEAA
jgi:hypothetical protein